MRHHVGLQQRHVCDQQHYLHEPLTQPYSARSVSLAEWGYSFSAGYVLDYTKETSPAADALSTCSSEQRWVDEVVAVSSSSTTVTPIRKPGRTFPDGVNRPSQ